MCLYSRMIINRKYTANKKNGGEIPLLKDERTIYVPIGCGNCIECRKQKAREWQIRLLEDIKTNKNGKFICLTFSNEQYKKLNSLIDIPPYKPLEGYDRDNAIATLAIRLFLERYRKKYTTSLRHWLVTELGHQGTENIHIHGIIWTDRDLNKIEQIWQYGFMWKGKIVNYKMTNYVNDRTVGYITKYVHKLDELHKTYKPIILTSPGIGHNYTNTADAKKNKFDGTQTKETYRTSTGHKIALPIYWRNKIYTDHEKEQLWLQRLNKQERWVRGEKVDISSGEQEYNELVKYYQAQNIQLGYGTDNKNWKLKESEKNRRRVMQLTRLINAKTLE